MVTKTADNPENLDHILIEILNPQKKRDKIQININKMGYKTAKKPSICDSSQLKILNPWRTGGKYWDKNYTRLAANNFEKLLDIIV